MIFTESRRTQEYLVRLLEESGHAGRVTHLNGSNQDAASRARYDAWFARHCGTAAVTGSRAVDTRAAIIEAFRDDCTILVATEAAAEGVNLQFCSLVVNYDLPWNPQRIEQRIGRCHRYGQQHDVVVVNLINRANAADERVFELLSAKFRLFEGVFGASDEVLGALEGGIDVERRIAEVYQTSRTPAEIGAAFDALQASLEQEITSRLESTRRAVLEHFDEDVQLRLHVHREQALESLAERQRILWELARFEFAGDATFDARQPRFDYRGALGEHGGYHLLWPDAERLGDSFFRPEHPLAQAAIERALARELPVVELVLGLSRAQPADQSLAAFAGLRGWLACGRLVATALREEQHLVLAGVSDSGEQFDAEQCRRMMRLAVERTVPNDEHFPATLVDAREVAIASVLADVDRRNAQWYDEEVAKLEAWADDLRTSLERELRELDRAIAEARRGSLAAATLAGKLEAQRTLKGLERTRAEKRRALYEAQDRIGERRDAMIAAIERQLGASHTWSEAFVVRWRMA